MSLNRNFPLKIALIGDGAISRYVQAGIAAHPVEIVALIMRPGRTGAIRCAPCVTCISDLPSDTGLVVDCAGHAGLRDHGPPALARGIDVITVSLGALADESLYAALSQAASEGHARLRLASGAIGALDALRAARTGGLDHVRYVGRKPPAGWRGSPAEDVLDLGSLTAAATHFSGSAGAAATQYPKNANVAAAVALASLGFEDTQVDLIADPSITKNVHEIEAAGAFGEMRFSIAGKALPDNPRSSALAAMSTLAAILDQRTTIGF